MRTASRLRKLWAFGAILILALTTSILFRDFRPPECTQIVTGPFSTQVLINCDSAQIVQDSQTPSRLWNAETSYQDRPLYTLTGYIISKPLRLLVDSSEIYENTRGESITFYYANYLGFILINFILLLGILWLSISMVKRLLPDKSLRSQIFLLATTLILLVANNVVKGFVWTPHTQLFNLLLVIYSINIWLQLENEQENRLKFVHYVVIGLLLFFYPMFVLLYLIPLLRNFKTHILPTFISIVPYSIYPATLTFLGGTYRNAAIEDFDGFIWVFRTLSQPGIVLDKVTLFAGAFLDLPIFYLAIALLTYCSLKYRGRLVREGWRYLFFIGAFATFIFFMGYSGPRLAFPILASMILYLCVFQIRFGNRQENKLIQFVVSGFALGIFFMTQGPVT